MVTKRSFKVSLVCRHCGKTSTYKITPPKPKLKRVDVTCLNKGCGYSWVYQGMLKRRVECPKCGSVKNEVSRKKFGSWTKKEL